MKKLKENKIKKKKKEKRYRIMCIYSQINIIIGFVIRNQYYRNNFIFRDVESLSFV